MRTPARHVKLVIPDYLQTTVGAWVGSCVLVFVLPLSLLWQLRMPSRLPPPLSSMGFSLDFEGSFDPALSTRPTHTQSLGRQASKLPAIDFDS